MDVSKIGIQPVQGVTVHSDPMVVSWPDYSEVYNWLCQEVKKLSDAQLDFDCQAPEQEWMWWSMRRQVSHVA